ncbi:MAG: yjeF-like protein [Planctomycetota bacterium]|nr:yjeF-like protein [Planctomycetota bacterium]
MTVRPLSRDEVRAIDRRAAEEFGLPTLVLMENAGRGAADLLLNTRPHVGPVVIACGPGNNGGDGGVVARHLDAHGPSVRVVWFAHKEKIAGDAAVQHKILAASGIDQQEWTGPIDQERLDALFSQADWIVDGLLGTGLTRPVEGVLRDVIEAMNRSGKPILALDLPSGLDADSGEPLGIAVRASQTATFVAPKLGFARPGAEAYTGRVSVVEIGVPRKLLEGFTDRVS